MSGVIEHKDQKESKLELNKPYVVRLCGYNFNTFRQGLHQPYDPAFQYAMVLTMNELIVAFGARTGHTHLYEIILLFDGNETPLTRAPSKLLTFYASYCTIRFNYHLCAQIMSEFCVSSYSPAKVGSVLERQAMFYGSFYQSDSSSKMIQYLVDRCRDKALGAAIFLWAQSLLPADVVQNKTCQELLPLLTFHRSIRWTLDVPIFVSYGVFAKLERHDEPPRYRSLTNRAFGMDDSDKTYRIMLDKCWPKECTLGHVMKHEQYFSLKIHVPIPTPAEDKPKEQEPESPPFAEQAQKWPAH